MKRLIIALALLCPPTLAAQSITLGEPWYGPAPGAQHAPIVKVSLGHLNGIDVKHWYVGGAPVPLAALAFGRDSAAVSPSPRLVWELDRGAFARLTGSQFTCKRAGDTRVRVRLLDAAGLTVAADSTTIRCH